MGLREVRVLRADNPARAQLIEGNANLLRLRQEVALLDDERAVVDYGVEAMDALLARLAGEPTPDGGPSPRERAGPVLPEPASVNARPPPRADRRRRRLPFRLRLADQIHWLGADAELRPHGSAGSTLVTR